MRELDAEESDMRSYQPVMEASEAEEVLESLRGSSPSGSNSDGQIEYSGREGQMMIFRLTNQGTNETSACFPVNSEEGTIENMQSVIAQLVYQH